MYKKVKAYLLSICFTAALLCGCSQTEKAETTAVETTDTVETTADTTVQTTSDTTVQTTSDTTDNAAVPQENLTEEQQIQALLVESGQFFYDCNVGKGLFWHSDYNNPAITRQVTLSDGELHDIPYYEVLDGDVLTKSDLINKMKPIFTDEFTDEMLLYFDESGHYYFDDNGKIYVVENTSGFLGYDALYITSVDEIDADTLVLNAAAYGSAENWGYDDGDAIEELSVTLKRTEDGLKIDKCDWGAREYIANLWRDIIFGSVPANN